MSNIEVTPSIAEAEALLEKARLAERQKAKAQAYEAERRAQADFDKASEGRVRNLEREVADAIKDASKMPSTWSVPAAVAAREYLRGRMPSPAYMGSPEQAACHGDGPGNRILGAHSATRALWSALCDLSSPGRHVGPALTDRIVAAERKAWQAFIARVREIAGEAS